MEMLIAIAVLAILVTLAVPSFLQVLQRNRLASEANAAVAGLNFARSEAIRRSRPVVLCASSSGDGCGGAWADGWIAIAEPGGAGEEVLRRWSGPGSDLTVSGMNARIEFPADASQPVDVDGDGETFDDDENAPFLELSSDVDGIQPRLIFVEPSGGISNCEEKAGSENACDTS
jgi:type II secretory pathway pseudopilin PulG